MNQYLRIIFVLSFVASALIAPRILQAQGAGETLVNGATDFLFDRANDNYIYIFQRKLESNELMKKYLPATLRVVKAGDLRALLTNTKLWENAFEEDKEELGSTILDELGTLINTKPCPKEGLADDLKEPCDKATHALENAKNRVADLVESLKKLRNLINKLCSENLADDLKEPCHGAKEELTKVGTQTSNRVAALVESLKKLRNLINNKLCSENLADGLKEPCDGAKEELTKVGTQTSSGKNKVKFHERSSLESFSRTPNTKSALTDLKNDLEQVEVAECTEVKKGGYTGCAIQINLLLDAFARADRAFSCEYRGNYCPDDDFDDFRRFVLFFAQMADAADTKESGRINVLLKSVTVPPVSFGIKREPYQNRVLITSYLGGAWARDENKNTFVLAAPVGIEISQTRDSGNSLSLFVSPFDFGYPLSLKLSDVDARAQISDILVPATYVLWGMKKYPLAIGLGYQRVRSVDTPDEWDGRWLVFFAFDMPLFKLH